MNSALIPELINSGVYVGINKLEAGNYSLSKSDWMEALVFFIAEYLSFNIRGYIPQIPQGAIWDVISQAIPIELLLLAYRYFVEGGFGSSKMAVMDLIKVVIALSLGNLVDSYLVNAAILPQ